MKIFKRNLKRIFGNKIKFAIMLIVPFLFSSLFLFGAFNSVTIGIVDNDNSKLTKNIIDELSKNQFFNLKIIDEDSMYSDVLSYEVDYAVKFEMNFEDNFIKNGNPLITDFYFVENENTMNAKSYIESYINNLKTISDSVDSKEQFYEVLTDFNNKKIAVDNFNDLSSKTDQSIASIGFMVYFLIFISVITCGIILEDKKNGTLARIFNSPISLKRYLFENLLSFVIVGFIQVIVLLFMFKFAFNFYYANGFIYILILSFMFILVCITMGLLIVSLVKTPIQAYLVVGVLASPLAMLGGCYWPASMMPLWLQNIAKFIPTTWIMTGAKDIIVNNGNIIDILDNLGILLLFSVLFFIGGIFKKTDFYKI